MKTKIPMLKHYVVTLKSGIKKLIVEYDNNPKICTNCGCPNPKKTYDGYWCKFCKTEM